MAFALDSIRGTKTFSPYIFTLLFTVLIFCIAPQAYSQDRDDFQAPASAPAEKEGYKPQPAIVMVHNRPVIIYRASLFGADPETRARSTEERISRILSSKEIGDVTTRQIPEGWLFLIGAEEAFLLTPGDMEPIFGETSEEIVNRALRNLKLAIKEVKELRDPGILIRGAVYTAAETVFLLFLLFVVSRFRRRINRALSNLEKKWTAKSHSKGFFLVEGAVTFGRWSISLIFLLVILLAVYTWLTFSLRQFPYTRAWGESLGQYLVLFLGNFITGFIDALPGLAAIVLIVLMCRLLNRIFRALFRAIENGQITFTWFDAELAKPTQRIVTAVVWLFAVILSYPYLPGSDSAAFKGVSLFVGLILSLGSTSLVQQAAGGLVLMYSRSYKAGHYIQSGETEGIVLSLGILSTKIKTSKGEEVIVPNAVMVSNTTRNLTRLAGGKGALIATALTIGYSTPWRQVHELLLMAAGRTPGLLEDPKPFVRQRTLSDFYVAYELVAVAETAAGRNIALSALHANIQDLFNEHEVQIMSPHYVSDPPQKVIAPRQKNPPRASAEEGRR